MRYRKLRVTLNILLRPLMRDTMNPYLFAYSGRILKAHTCSGVFFAVFKGIVLTFHSIQYRMHPEISRLPSKLFYNGRLSDGPGMAQSTARPWHSNSRFGTYRFYNIHAGIEQQNGHSIKNSMEVNATLTLYERLKAEYPKHDFDSKIGIVTMYRGQLNELKSTFVNRFGKDIRNVVDFNTVDGFQVSLALCRKPLGLNVL